MAMSAGAAAADVDERYYGLLSGMPASQLAAQLCGTCYYNLSTSLFKLSVTCVYTPVYRALHRRCTQDMY